MSKHFYKGVVNFVLFLSLHSLKLFIKNMLSCDQRDNNRALSMTSKHFLRTSLQDLDAVRLQIASKKKNLMSASTNRSTRRQKQKGKKKKRKDERPSRVSVWFFHSGLLQKYGRLWKRTDSLCRYKKGPVNKSMRISPEVCLDRSTFFYNTIACIVNKQMQLDASKLKCSLGNIN